MCVCPDRPSLDRHDLARSEDAAVHAAAPAGAEEVGGGKVIGGFPELVHREEA
jgi:hypothetical protein